LPEIQLVFINGAAGFLLMLLFSAELRMTLLKKG